MSGFEPAGYFSESADSSGPVFTANAMAKSGWGTQLRGPAVSGLIAREVERTMADRSDLTLVRWTVDMIRPAVDLPSKVTTEVVRNGRRISLIEARFMQDGNIIALASALYLRPGGTTTGETWNSSDTPLAPPAELIARAREGRVFFSEEAGWTVEPEPHQNAQRKQLWHGPVHVVSGEVPSPFVMVATAADTTNLTTNWGTAGLEFINADVTLYLTRLPDPGGVGLAARTRTESDGISVGTTAVFDSRGVVGTCTVSALANADAAVDPRKVFSQS